MARIQYVDWWTVPEGRVDLYDRLVAERFRGSFPA
jgi:hypothetical protein